MISCRGEVMRLGARCLMGKHRPVLSACTLGRGPVPANARGVLCWRGRRCSCVVSTLLAETPRRGHRDEATVTRTPRLGAGARQGRDRVPRPGARPRRRGLCPAGRFFSSVWSGSSLLGSAPKPACSSPAAAQLGGRKTAWQRAPGPQAQHAERYPGPPFPAEGAVRRGGCGGSTP